MPRTTEVVQKIRDARREQIIKAALKVFARYGFAATKITDIAAAAHISHGLVNHYFSTKEELYHAIVVETLEGAVRVASQASERPGSAWERLGWLCQNMLDGIRDTPEYSLVLSQVGVTEGLPGQVKERYAYYSQAIQEKIERLIEHGQRQGAVIAGDPAQLAHLFLAVISGLSLIAIDPNVGIKQIPTRPDAILRILKA